MDIPTASTAPGDPGAPEAEPGSAPSGSTNESSNGPRAVHRALELLSLVIDRDEPGSLLDLANAAGLPSSTALRNLRALEHWGFVFRDDDGGYSPGPRFVNSQIPVGSDASADLIELSLPYLEETSRRTGESSYLAIPGPAGTCIYLREVQTTQPIRFVGFDGWTGRTVSRAGSAVGEILDGRVPEHGYCVLPAALTPEAHVIAAPIRDGSGEIIAALSIAGPSFRLDRAGAAAQGPVVRSIADAIGKRLGALPGPPGRG